MSANDVNFFDSSFLPVLQSAFSIDFVQSGFGHKNKLVVFKSLFLRVGFLGFPGGVYTLTEEDTVDLSPRKLFQLSDPHIIRLFCNNEKVKDEVVRHFSLCSVSETVETRILELQSWRESTLPSSIRRNIKRARKNNLKVVSAGVKDAKFIYDLYVDTVVRQGGSLRYNLPYFTSLMELAQETNAIHSVLAYYDGEPVAVNICVHENNTVYYLHGGFQLRMSSFRVADFLMNEAINWGVKVGATEFNFMSSPVTQAGLIHYKEKWGGVSRFLYTIDCPRNILFATLWRAAKWGLAMFSGLKVKL